MNRTRENLMQWALEALAGLVLAALIAVAVASSVTEKSFVYEGF